MWGGLALHHPEVVLRLHLRQALLVSRLLFFQPIFAVGSDVLQGAAMVNIQVFECLVAVAGYLQHGLAVGLHQFHIGPQPAPRWRQYPPH